MRYEVLIAEAGDKLVSAGIENGVQECRWLLMQLLNNAQEYSCLAGGSELPPEIESEFRQHINRRANGEPLQYIMGSAAFHCIEVEVGPGVLIPRPETEQLVELALSTYHESGMICDVCTGSGAIALAIAKSRPMACITGIDISDEALAYANHNKEKLALDNVTFLKGDLFAVDGVQLGRYSLITANPPYVSDSDYATLESVVKDYEPRLALVAENNGLGILERLAKEVPAHLAPGGFFISEIGDEQGKKVLELFRQSGFTDVQIHKDYAGKDRFLLAKI